MNVNKRTEINLNNNCCTDRSRPQSQKQRFPDYILFQLFFNAGKIAYIFSRLQHLRPPCRRDSFDNFDKTLMRTRNNGLKYKEIKGLMYCFAEAG